MNTGLNIADPKQPPPIGEPFTQPESERGQAYRVMDASGRVGKVHKCHDCQYYFEDWPYCSAANGAGQVFFWCESCYVERRLRQTQEELAQAGERKRLPIEIKVPPLYMSASMTDIAPKFRKAIELWPFTHKFLAITGTPGSGKTHIVYAVAKRLALDGRRCMVEFAPEMKSLWTDSLKGLGSAKLITEWKNTNWLLIDDLSSPTASEGWTALLHEIIDARLSWQRPTLLTMTNPGGELGARYTDSIRSRLSMFEWVTLLSASGKALDWRRIMGAQKP